MFSGNGGKVTNANGYDIIFTSDSGGTTPLACEQVPGTYSASTGSVEYWVKVPTVSHTADTVIYVQYGNASISTNQCTASAVWDTNFKGVWHLANGSTLSGTDSTSNANNGTATNATAATGQIDGGMSLSGTGWLDMGANVTSLQPASTLTIESWFKPTGTQGNWSNFVNQDYSNPRANPNNSYALFANYNTHNTYEFIVSTGGSQFELNSNVSIVTNQWAHVVATYNGSTSRVYVNGTQANSQAQTGTISYATTGIFRLGANSTGGDTATGVIDEVRVSNTVRSADWIAAEYANMNSPSTFYTLGSEVGGLTGGGRLILR